MIGIYDTTTGQFKRVTTAEGQALAGEAEYPDVPLDISETHYVNVVPQNPVLIPFPPRPTDFHFWDWSQHAWLPDVEAAREFARTRIDANTAQTISDGANVNGNIYHAEDSFLIDVQAMIVGLENGDIPPPVSIIRKDNQIEEFTLEPLRGLFLAIHEYRRIARSLGRNEKDAVNQATTIADVVSHIPP